MRMDNLIMRYLSFRCTIINDHMTRLARGTGRIAGIQFYYGKKRIHVITLN